MSIDLYVTRRGRPIRADEFAAALATMQTAIPELVTFALEDALAPSLYFDHVDRVSVAFIATPDEELVPEVGGPYVVVSSRSGAWPWIDYTAVALATALRGEVFDPQQGEPYATLVAEHSLDELRTLHAQDIAERKPQLVSSYWAMVDATLSTVVAHARSAARLTLRGTEMPDPGDGAINWSADVGVIHLSSFASWPPGGPRSVVVSGPVEDAQCHAFAGALGRELGVELRRVDEYR